MSFNRFNEDMNIIVKLDDEPNDVGGMSAEAFKAEFDESGILIKDYINNVLLPALEASTAAGNIGVAQTVGLEDATNIQAALEKILTAMRGISQGAVAPGSIGTDELAPGSVTNPKLAANAVKAGNIAAGAVGHTQLGAACVESDNIKAGSVTDTKMAAESVKTAALDDKAVTAAKMGDNCLLSRHFSENCVPPESIPNSSLTEEKLSSTLKIPVTKGGTGAATPEAARKNLGVPNIGYGAALPTSGSEGDIFFVRV